MRTWFMSRTGTLTLAILITVGIALPLVSGIAEQGLTTRTVGASSLALSFPVFAFGGVLFSGRMFLKWPIAENSHHLIWERGFIIAAALATALGLVLLADMLRAAGDTFLAQSGMVAYVFGAAILVVAETAFLSKGDWNYAQIIVYIVLAFLGQAAIGLALLQTGLVAAWVGWVTIIWNLAWLIILPTFSRDNMYFPVLHHVAPLIIGIVLVAGK